MILLLSALLLIAPFGRTAEEEDVRLSPIVSTNLGDVVGTVNQSADGRQFFSFRGIPYAKSPVGELRFKPPIRHPGWDDVYDATNDGSRCPQNDVYFGSVLVGEEDCLFLNVYTPHLHPSHRLPVMVWLHGGGFLHGGGDSAMFDPGFIMDEDVVLVSFNYRLSVFGFLSTGDSASPGNYGLYDQIMALRWVKENVDVFGGDHDRVTIFGQSAGGASVSYHIISPLSKGLFHRAIIKSGTALCPWAFRADPLEVAEDFASSLYCPISNTDELVSCLRKMDWKKIMEQDKILHESSKLSMVTQFFSPTVEYGAESPFLDDFPLMKLLSGSLNDVPVMSGGAENEAAIITSDEKLLAELAANFDADCMEILHLHKYRGSKDILDKIRNFYFPHGEVHAKHEQSFHDMLSDGLFIHCLELFSNYYITHSSHHLYQYSFNYRGNTSFSDMSSPGKDVGAVHSDVTLYLFPVSFGGLVPAAKQGTPDRDFSRKIVKIWTNFAKTGDPGIESLQPDLSWPPRTETERNYLILDQPFSVDQDLFQERIEFWRQLGLEEMQMKEPRDEL